MTAARRVGVLGGTFDPIHAGHLAAARVAQGALALDAVLFVPSGEPPHRTDKPRASGYHRGQMTAAAVAGIAGWTVSDIELAREGPSYTFDTLTELRRRDGGRSQFFFILGADAFAEIATWSRYPAVLDLAHFAVIARPGGSFESLRSRLPALAPRMMGPGHVVADRPSIIPIPAETPGVSSSDIRRRAAAGEPLTGLVPDPVERYIVVHELYKPAGPQARRPAVPPGKPLA